MRKLVITIPLFFGFYFGLFAAKVDTIEVYSQAMDKNIKTVVITPDVMKEGEFQSTVYLLHGYSGNYSNWVNRVPHIKELVDHYQMVMVCPDGGYGSWYWDIEGDQSYQYETFVVKELVKHIEENYPVSTDRKHRAITGLSMGGHGAMYLALRNQDIYGAVGSMSGGVDLRPWPNNWEIKDRLGDYQTNQTEWDQRSVINMLHLYQPGQLEIFVDCGTGDFFYEVNEALHIKMLYFNIPHHYLTRPGQHNWDFWSESILYQVEFFVKCFSG